MPFFFFNDTATTEIYTLSLHDALPIYYSYYYHNSYAMNQYLASRGYMVLSVNYRSGIGYGRAFREAKHRGPRGASEYQDVVAAGKEDRERTSLNSRHGYNSYALFFF